MFVFSDAKAVRLPDPVLQLIWEANPQWLPKLGWTCKSAMWPEFGSVCRRFRAIQCITSVRIRCGRVPLREWIETDSIESDTPETQETTDASGKVPLFGKDRWNRVVRLSLYDGEDFGRAVRQFARASSESTHQAAISSVVGVFLRAVAKRFPSVKYLHIGGFVDTDLIAALASAHPWPDLRSCSIEDSKESGKGALSLWNTFPKLSKLWLFRGSADLVFEDRTTEEGAALAVPNCTGFRSEHLFGIAERCAPTLQHLDLSRCSLLKSEDLLLLATLSPEVSTLVLANISWASASLVQAATLWTRLRRLAFTGCSLYDAGLLAIVHACPGLEELLADNCQGLSPHAAALLKEQDGFTAVVRRLELCNAGTAALNFAAFCHSRWGDPGTLAMECRSASAYSSNTFAMRRVESRFRTGAETVTRTTCLLTHCLEIKEPALVSTISQAGLWLGEFICPYDASCATDAVLRAIFRECPNMREVRFGGTPRRNLGECTAGGAVGTELPAVYLSLVHCRRVTHAVLDLLEDWRGRVRGLEIRGCPALPAAAVRLWLSKNGGCPKLKELILDA